ncbi:MAG: hypothetical protein IJU41_03300, partial [Clostridia bacterium]|nr:hypothetical protein [Clostridia bacterium]
MKRSLVLLIAVFCLLLALTAFADGDVVYLDGTGATPGAYTDFKTAVSALPSGGTVILSGDTTVGTAGTGVTLDAVGGKVTVTSINGARFIFARSLTFNSELEFDNINIHSTATASGNIICRGNKLTMGAGVTITKASGAIDLCIIGGWDSGTRTLDSDIVLHGGTYRAVYAANYSGTFNGTSRVELSGVTVGSTLSYGNYMGTYNGTGTVVLDLRG